jgi:membrane-associated phospholipid phosphatase
LNKRLSLLISVVFHPLLMPTFLLGTLFFLAPSIVGTDVLGFTTRLTLLGFVAITTFTLPALTVYYMYRAGYVSSLHLESLPERRLPYLVTALVYGFMAYFFRYRLSPLSDVVPSIGVFLASISFSVLLAGVISYWWKISAHAIGVGGFLGAIGAVAVKFTQLQLLVPLAVIVLIAGAVLSARLRLNAHTPAQVAAGLGVGIFINVLTVWLFI